MESDANINLTLIVFLLALFPLLGFWGKVGPLVTRLGVPQKLALWLNPYFTVKHEILFRVIRGTIYTVTAIVISFALLSFFDLNTSELFKTWNADFILITLIGALTQASLSIFFSQLMFFFVLRSANIGQEMGNVGWISSIQSLPMRLQVIMVSMGSMSEEFLFRGALLIVFTSAFGINPFIAILLVTLFFIYQQIIQVNTLAQALVITSGSLTISLVGSLMFFYTENILSAMIAHASSIIFYVCIPKEHWGRDQGPTTVTSASG
ncbi:MAG: hypothetical protein OEZ58_19545 [Gammaproteobacteria bacterium]|nr:hypothetical protein [Gammaproteobacteria bacterium]MDH5731185.1 hypothetical protein [Gammaproteobacteria bacterium]